MWRSLTARDAFDRRYILLFCLILNCVNAPVLADWQPTKHSASNWVFFLLFLCLYLFFFMLISLHVDSLMRHISKHPSLTSVYLLVLYLHDVLLLLDTFLCVISFHIVWFVVVFLRVCLFLKSSVSLRLFFLLKKLIWTFSFPVYVPWFIQHEALLVKDLQGCNFRE